MRSGDLLPVHRDLLCGIPRGALFERKIRTEKEGWRDGQILHALFQSDVLPSIRIILK